jgi:predicted RNA-binding protein with TRAM domain
MNKNGNQADTVSQPVNEGEELTVTIEAVGEKGDGICKKKGFILFVPNTTEGEVCKIRVTKVLSKVGFGEVLERKGERDKPSPEEQQTSTQQRYTAPAPSRPSKPKKEDTEDFGKELELEEDEGSFADEFSDAFSDEDDQVPSKSTSSSSEQKETSEEPSKDSSTEEEKKEKSSSDEIPVPEEDSKKKVMAEEPDDVVPEP